MIQIKKFTFNPVSVNAYLLWDETLEAVLIDPACFYPAEEEKLSRFVEQQGLTIVGILNTHGHFDHLMGNGFAVAKWNQKCRIHSGDAHMPGLARQYASMFGITMQDQDSPFELLEDKELITFGRSSLQVIHVPGHSPGGVAFFAAQDKMLVVGDIIFEGSVGRTDLPGGNHRQLIEGMTEKLICLGDDVRIFPGHGGETTVGKEKRSNPFLQGQV